MIVAFLLQAAAPAEAAPDCSRQLCLRGHRLTALPDQRWLCADAARRGFTLAIAGPPRQHERLATIAPVGLKLPAGVADNRYAPYAIDLGDATTVVENFVAQDAKATYYLTLSIKLDRKLVSPTGSEDVGIRGARYDITRGVPGRMAKPFAAGACTIMEQPSL